jgi:Predicted acetyltransferase
MKLIPHPQVIGVALNGIQHEGDVDEAIKKLETLNDKKFKQIFSMLYDLNQSLNLFSRYDVTSIFECRILSVDNNYRGRGLANELFKLSIDIASKAGFKVSYFCDFLCIAPFWCVHT